MPYHLLPSLVPRPHPSQRLHEGWGLGTKLPPTRLSGGKVGIWLIKMSIVPIAGKTLQSNLLKEGGTLLEILFWGNQSNPHINPHHLPCKGVVGHNKQWWVHIAWVERHDLKVLWVVVAPKCNELVFIPCLSLWLWLGLRSDCKVWSMLISECHVSHALRFVLAAPPRSTPAHFHMFYFGWQESDEKIHFEGCHHFT